jgi:hypothetical protein
MRMSLPNRVLHTLRSSASSFSLQYLLVSLRSSSSCLLLLASLAVTSILPSICPSLTCFRRQLLRKMWPIQVAFLLLIVFSVFLSSLTLCQTSSFFTPSIQLSCTVLLKWHISKVSRYFWYKLLSEVSHYRHRTKLCSKCSISLISSLNLSPICRWKELSSCWKLLLPGFNFTCTFPCIILFWFSLHTCGLFMAHCCYFFTIFRQVRFKFRTQMLGMFPVWFN